MIQYKSFVQQALDVDTTSKRVKVAIAKMGNEDSDKDIILPGAFTKTLKERGPSGSKQIWHLADHQPSLKSAFGKFTEMGIEGDYLFGVSVFKSTPLWEQAWPMYEAGDITEHSIGFSIPKNGAKSEKGIRYISEIKLYEGSSVLWGANSDTPTLNVFKSITFEEKKDLITKELDYLTKNISRIDEDNLSLFTIKLEQLKTLIAEFTKDANQTEQGSSDPDGEIATRIKLLTLSI